MDEIEVEAVDAVGDDVGVTPGTAEYVLYGGKGGVGKTTMAAATALASANDGTETLVVSTDPAHSLSDTFETDVPSRPARIREDVPLWGVEIDPEDAVEQADLFGGDGAGTMGGVGEMGELLGMGGDEAGPQGMMPGADEAAAMQLLLQYMDDERFDRVVVDTAPTGHTLRLLDLPELLDSMMGRMMQFRERIGGMMDSMKGMFGGEDGEQGTGDLDELKAQVRRLRSVLRDPDRTDFRIVMVPETMSVHESTRLRGQLDAKGIPVSTLVVNRIMEPLTDVADAPADAFVTPNLDSCEFCQRRWDVQKDALAEAQELFRGVDVKRVPLFADEVRGEAMLRVVAACLD
ncbi:ArsA family ATPase [Halocalculus aciditolerans]|uniref:Arsenic-transporting ATPase n=1 Tax=Halocalculus aciditolerans TaxID=1383812 RepID=A0A830F7Z6_9EURY|nr:TRC40/GET3/ArsA family transport-energizing ATPase [Halocalculus aciditolerans]GGL63620.1 arsenic-transporting ATPase [Halocalculus aciditolerans]